MKALCEPSFTAINNFMKYHILGRLGGGAPLISSVFNMMGYSSYHGSFNKPDDSDTAILITYQYDMFAWVMTARYVEDILYNYNLGNKENFNHWLTHYVGPGKPSTPEDISMSDWTDHVVQSYRHIGINAPLNGVYEELELICQDSKCKRYDLPVELILNNPNQAIIRIEKIAEKTMDDRIKNFFLSEVEKQKELLSPWMDEYYKAKEKSTGSYVWRNNSVYRYVPMLLKSNPKFDINSKQ